MYKSYRIIIFLTVFLFVVSIPLLLNVGRATEAPLPSLDTPAINSLANQMCVEPLEYMQSSHMQLLADWRDEVVRSGRLMYTSSSGQVFEASLENSCLSCHSNRVEFCDSCHDFLSVKVDCWSCHLGGEDLVGAKQ